MNRKQKSFIITVLWIIFLFTPAVFADGVELEVFLDGDEAYVGQDITIVVRYRSDQAMESIDAEISYDREKLEYRYGGGNIGYLSGGTGGITDIIPMGSNNRTYYFTFRGLEEGEATFSIDFSDVLSYESGSSLGTPRESLTFVIEVSEEKPPEDENGTVTPPSPVEPPDIGEDYIEWEHDGVLYFIYRDGREGSLPPNFSYETIRFDGEEITGAKHNSSKLKLIYAIPEQGGSRWYIYDDEDETIYSYREIQSEYEYILLDVEENIAEFMIETILIDGDDVDVLSGELLPEGVYLVYALDRMGAPHYYFYDEEEGTFQRAIITRGEVMEYIEIEGERDERGFPMWTIYSVGGFIAILVLSMIGIHYNAKKEPPPRRRRSGTNNQGKRGVEHE